MKIINIFTNLLILGVLLPPSLSLAMEGDSGDVYRGTRQLYRPIPNVRNSLRETPVEIFDREKKSSFPPLRSRILRPRITLDPLVENQGQLGTCSSFAVVECLKFLHNHQLSQPYLIVNTEEKFDNCIDDGVSIGDAMMIAKNKGVIGQKWWDYNSYYEGVLEVNRNDGEDDDSKDGEEYNNPLNICIEPPFDKHQDKELVKFGFKEIESIFHEDRNACVAGQPCNFSKSSLIQYKILEYSVPAVVSVPVVWAWGWMDDQGDVKIPERSSLESSKIDGWHAITIYNYNDVSKTFNFKNSWGPTWGKHRGYGTISCDYIDKYASEAWIGYGPRIWVPYSSSVRQVEFYGDILG